ncbi:SBBP repeat-containing protein [Niastella sp. OAS944]|uniref:SBBP repeat-containing protein n=1 Tax=Niastella sp. OAS944 TaxID=2664089 RepID=UPI0034934090|nr:hypothetical protein [Chitinophagaceae bacterium OAS944]
MRKMVLIVMLWLFSTLLFSAVGFTQVSEEWVVREPAPGPYDGARSLAIDNAGNVYVTGSASVTDANDDYLTIKYNAAGVKQWEARYNGAANLDDDAFSIAVDGNGNVYITGRSQNETANDLVTIKYDAAGVMQWVATHNGFGHSIAVDGAGNVYVTGETVGFGPGNDYITIKYNTNGIQQWLATYDGPGNNDAAEDLAIDAAGNVYVTGRSPAGIDIDEEDRDYVTIKYDNNGNELWVRRYDGPVAGNFSDEARAITVDASGNIYVTGSSAGNNAEDGQDIATIKYDTNGNELWVSRFNGPVNSFDVPFDIAVDASQNVYVTGTSAAEPYENGDYITLKYDATGTELWVARYNGTGNGDDVATSLALDVAGNVYVTGRSLETGTAYDLTTIKYNSTGVQQWIVKYNGPASGNDGTGIFIGFFTQHSLAVDALGNVYVTGLSTGIGTGFDYTTIKYSQASLTACGKNGDKVLICHKGKTTCISQSAVAGHLKHGDQLGACADNARIVQTVTAVNEFRVSVIPNPAVVTTKIFYELPVDGRVSIKIFDMLGREITTLTETNKQAGIHSIGFNVAPLQKGMYYYRITVKSTKQLWLKTGKISVD